MSMSRLKLRLGFISVLLVLLSFALGAPFAALLVRPALAEDMFSGDMFPEDMFSDDMFTEDMFTGDMTDDDMPEDDMPDDMDDMAEDVPDSMPENMAKDMPEANVSSDKPVAGFNLERILRDHPALKSATERICHAYFVKLQSRSTYFPRIDMTLQAGNKWIDETTRSDEYGGSNSPEYDGKGLNATLSLRQQVYDWGRTRASIDGAQSQEAVARLERLATMDEQLSTFFNMAFQYVLQDQLTLHLTDARKKIASHLESIEARYKAGASRLSEVRQARLVLLTFDGQIDESHRQRAQVVHSLKTQFGVTPIEAALAVSDFRNIRPDMPETVSAESALQSRILRQNILSANADMRRLQATRLPTIEGLVTARGWDISEGAACNDPVPTGHDDAVQSGARSRVAGRTGYAYRDKNCSTYEVTGGLQFSMPLYDGGANRAERYSVVARLRGLENSLAAAHRSHDAETRRLQDELLGLLRQVADNETEVGELEKEVDGELSRQRATRADPLALMQIRQRLAETQARYIVLIMRAEAARMQGLAQAGDLARTLGITLGASGC